MIAATLGNYVSADVALLVERILLRRASTIPPLESEATLLKWVLEHTQHYWLREKGRERWELQGSESIDGELANLLDGSNLFAEQEPPCESVDNVLLMSAHEPIFLQRLEYFSSLLRLGLRAKNFFLLGGERTLDPTTEAAMIKSLKPDAREVDMLDFHVTRISKRDAHLAGIHFIRSSTSYREDQTGLKRRPNTEDTVVTWKNEHYQGGSVLCLSNQPFVHYQTSVVRSVLGEDILVYGAGAAVDQKNVNLELVLDTLARLLYVSLSSKDWSNL